MDEEMMFMGVDIPKDTKNLVLSKTDIITNGMNESEKKAYLLGVNNTISAIECIVSCEHIVIHTYDEKFQGEIDYYDLEAVN